MMQFSDVMSAKRAIRDKVIDLARRRGIDASDLQDGEVIPERGILDSVAIMELIVWFETNFDVAIDQRDLTLENFGTVDAMTSYLQRV